MSTLDDAIRQAVDRAFRDPDGSFAVYTEPDAVYVRDAKAVPPAGSRGPHCIVQRWDDNTVQVRYAGARSEWVKR